MTSERSTGEIPTLLSIRPHALTVWVRVALLVLVAVLLSTTRPTLLNWTWYLALVLAAAPTLFVSTHRLSGRIGRYLEVIIACLGSAYAMGAEGATLPYIAAPVFAAGIFTGVIGVTELVIAAFVTLIAAGIGSSAYLHEAYLLQAAEWVTVAFAVGMLGAWIQSLARGATKPEYKHATQLLTQLRTIARQLPGTLDPVGIAEHLLQELNTALGADRSAVFIASGSQRLEVLYQQAPERLAWETSVTADTAVADAWASQQPQLASSTLVRGEKRSSRGDVSVMVLPLVTGVRSVGLVVMESDTARQYTPADLLTAAEIARKTALPLETALLFDEVRTIATTQERQRLAREIHDGVAQELVMVGYGIDNAAAFAEPNSLVAEQLQTLRAEVTRVITELRLSLFELRSDVDRHGGLGAAIAEYARTVGNSAGLRVHLSLDESTARLPAATEAELLRIAQESITNARKHARAENLWVSCEIDPPYVKIEISDDGQGMGATREKKRDDGTTESYGLSIMRERAERIRGELRIFQRKPRGTVVSVSLEDSDTTEVAPVHSQIEDGHGTVTGEKEVHVGDETNDARLIRPDAAADE